MTEPPRQRGFGSSPEPDLSAVTIRPYETDDRAFLRLLIDQLAPSEAATVLHRQLAAGVLTEQPDVIWFIATGAKQLPLGILALRPEEIVTRRRITVSLIAVAAGIDSQKVGSAMLAFTEDWAREHGAAEVAIEHMTIAPHATAFYEAHGYTVGTVTRVKRLE